MKSLRTSSTRNKKILRLFAALSLAAALAAVFSLALGPVSVAPWDVVAALFGGNDGSAEARIVLYARLPRRGYRVFVALLVAMVAGRVVWGVARLVLAQVQAQAFTMSMFVAGAITSAVPGIVLQLILIPVIVLALERAGQTFAGEKRA